MDSNLKEVLCSRVSTYHAVRKQIAMHIMDAMDQVLEDPDASWTIKSNDPEAIVSICLDIESRIFSLSDNVVDSKIYIHTTKALIFYLNDNHVRQLSYTVGITKFY